MAAAGYLLASGVLTPKGPQHLLNMHQSGTPVLFSKPEDVLTVSRPAGEWRTTCLLLKIIRLLAYFFFLSY
jgi:hypothetical protein